MDGRADDPTSRELLERIAALEAQTAKLAARVEDLEKGADHNYKSHMQFIPEGDRMRTFPAFLVSTACMLTLGLASANADPIIWSLTDVSFGDGGTASGSFVFDATSASFGAIDITTTPGTEFGGAAYTTFAFGNPLFLTSVTGSFPTLTGTPFLSLNFTSPLTDAGGIIPLGIGSFGSISVEGTCLVADCGSGSVARFVTSGEVSAVPGPIAGAGLPGLILAGVGLLGWWRRRQKNA
jgi:hypothetical protein